MYTCSTSGISFVCLKFIHQIYLFMKRSLLLLFFGLCFTLFNISKSHAQSDTTLARVLYTNSERTAIIGKTIGWNKPDTVYGSKVLANGRFVTYKNLTPLASTNDGNSLLISARAYFFNPNVLGPDSLWVILRVDAPFTNTGYYIPKVGSTPATMGGSKILMAFTFDEVENYYYFTANKMMPIGVLTPQENQWYVSPNKNSPGKANQWFFHGNFDGSGTVDSFYIDPTNTNLAINAGAQGYHMTNLVTSDDGKTMIAVIFDELISDKPRAQVFSWTPSVPAGSYPYSFADISGVIRGQVQPQGLHPDWNIDSSFAFTLHAIRGNTPALCQLGLFYNAKQDIDLYQFRASGSISIINDNGDHLVRGNLPKGTDGKTLQFFTGYTGTPTNIDDDKEVVPPEKGFPLGNGGDLQFSPGGDSIVFVTCRSDATATAEESGIYIMDLSSGKVDSVINDPTKMERQPIFTKSVVHKYVAPPPPTYVLGTATADSTALVFGGDTVKTPTTTLKLQTHFTLKTNNASEIIITKAILNNNNFGAFALVSPTQSQLPTTIKGGNSQTFLVSFTPPNVASFTAQLEIHYNDSLTKLDGKNRPDSVVFVNLSGTGVKQVTGGVAANHASTFDIAIVPNPFTSSTQITVSAQEAGRSTLEIRDILGKEVYASREFMLSAGEKYNYTLDANALHLSPGTYFVIVRSSGEELTRQAIYVK
jgi:hypothetical protein